jgi:UDP-N-acetylglucosamine--N-acetylmuramyl-(pentapeptide) pyrophosphoryl-undecaprenol N-acetylglucosamine transferase
MRLLVAGGGTGGHLYTGIAVAEEVMARPGGEVLFVGTDRGLEVRAVPAAGYPLELISVSGLKRVGLAGQARGLARLPLALGRSLSILRAFRPDAVLGVGGYASGPVVMAAALARYPTAILEQNTVPGFTNRLLGRLVRTVFTAFEASHAAFPRARIHMTGNPLRKAILAAAARATAGAKAGAGPAAGAASSTKERAIELLQLPRTELVDMVRDEMLEDAGAGGRLLVVGGSQGSRAVNDLVLAAAGVWARGATPPRIVHQTGTADAERVGAAYATVGLPPGTVEVRAFIDDMAAACAQADLVVARAGALTLAELAVLGVPAILIPLPTAADDHQTKNAAAYADRGAAVLLPQAVTTGDRLAQEVSQLLADAPRRESMATAMKALARPRAAAEITDHLESLVRK